MILFSRMLKGLIGLLFTGILLISHAQISQAPLLTKAVAVEPNFVFMLDDSGSMYYGSIYEYGGSNNYLGITGPSVKTYAGYSPDVNKIYYDPRIRYKLRINSNGTSQAAGRTDTYVIDQNCDPQAGGSNCFGGNAPETTTSGAYTIKVYFRNGSGAYTTTSVNNVGAYFTPAYSPPASEVVAGSVATYPNINTSTLTIFPKFIARTDCVTSAISCTWSEERQNYANWLAYHSNRMRLAKTGIGLAFQPLGATFRLGWSTINDLDDNKQLVSGVQLYNTTVASNFFTWLYGFDNSASPSGTPNLNALDRVGVYYSRKDNTGPWADNPTASTAATSASNTSIISSAAAVTTHASCRRSYSLLMTDGYYNPRTITAPFTGVGGPPGNTDGTVKATIPRPVGSTLPTYTYNPIAYPFRDSNSDTMADLAFKYWITDLRPDLENRVPTVSGLQTNESYWQNMSFYAIGLGVIGSLPQTTTTLANLATTPWPNPVANTPSTIDDMWHATINSRGKLLSARNADQLNDAIETMMAEVNKITSSQSGVAASSISLTNGTRKYTPKYTTGAWVGDVVATALDPTSGAERSVTWQVVGTDPATSTTYSGIPAYTSRNIYSWDGLAYGSFNATNTYVNGSVVGATTNLINYLRGDRTNEDPNGTSLYRAREVLLGDIVNSSPVFIKGGLNSSYNLLPAGTYGQSTYAAFVASKAARSEGVLFAGANDGMLHGFRDTTGAEIFAFVPRAVMPKLHLLASKAYANNHQYYVDGPNVEADACLTGGTSCTTWTNLLVGTAGAGAKTVYALDVTAPTSMTAANIKWEITTATTGYANLGHILTDVQTGLTMSGDWVAVFGNGSYGADGVARLYIANLNTGALIKEISTGVGSSNGLGGVRLVRDANQRIIGAYAGDLKGNLWKFDLSNTSSASWALGLSNSPLYNATSAKPITAPPTVVTHPNGGRVVVFGTGKLFDSTDVTSTTTQSLYGVWDSVAFGTSTTPAGVTQTGTASLVLQTISAAITGTTVITNSNLTTSTATITYFSVSRNTVDFTIKRGWYIDLPNTGQRITNPIEALVGQFVLIDSLSPSNVSSDPCVQTGTGRAWNYVIDGVTGSGPASAIFDTNRDNIINASDGLYSGYESNADGRTRVIRNDTRSTSTSTYFTPLSTQQQPGFSISCQQTGTCLNSPSVSAVIKRSWRQLFLR